MAILLWAATGNTPILQALTQGCCQSSREIAGSEPRQCRDLLLRPTYWEQILRPFPLFPFGRASLVLSFKYA